MARVLVYTSPALGHHFPALGPATVLADRGHEVHMIGLEGEVARSRSLGLRAEAMDPAIEAEQMDDFLAGNPLQGVARAVATFARRAPFEAADLKRALASYRPDVVLVDTNCFGARTVAEASALPWCCFQPFLTPLPSDDVPPFGPGLAPAAGVMGRLRDLVLRRLVTGTLEKLTLAAVNPLRHDAGLDPVRNLADFYTRPPKTLYLTTEDFDYPRSDWPDSFVMCGPTSWESPVPPPAWLDRETRDIVLVTCSTEAQSDRPIIENLLRGLADTRYYVVATTGAQDPASFDVPANARVERFVPHAPLIDRAVAVVCHGGMGITQKALARGVPVCVVPHGRDQLEVARRVEHAGAGVRVPAGRFSPAAARRAVEQTILRKPQADRIAAAFRKAGGAERAADEILGLVGGVR